MSFSNYLGNVIMGLPACDSEELMAAKNYVPYAGMSYNQHGKSGFFDLPKEDVCNDLEHDPPMHLCIPRGQGYRHICSRCGKVRTLMSPQIIC